MTWQLTPCCVVNFGNGIPTTLEGLVGATTADFGAASRPNSAVVVAAPSHGAHGTGGAILVAGGRNRGRCARRRAPGSFVRARFVPPVEHGGPVRPGPGCGE